jgi:hypothetical protein
MDIGDIGNFSAHVRKISGAGLVKRNSVGSVQITGSNNLNKSR